MAVAAGRGPARHESAGPDDVQPFLLASRALVAVAARSVDEVQSDLTLPQYRALVVLGSRGGLKVTVLADEVGVHAASRPLLDRVRSRREADIAGILSRMRPEERVAAVDALRAFAAAAGEQPEQHWPWVAGTG